MIANGIREIFAAHLIRAARDDIPVDKIREYLTGFGLPHDAYRDELEAIAALINDAQITITWEEVTTDAGASAHSGHEH